LNSTLVLQAIGYSTGSTLYHTLYNNAVGMIILACAGSLPGYWAAVLTIDTLGRKPLQIIGFVILTILFCILGFAYQYLSQPSMLALYIVAQFFFNWGPNTTTFIIPGEVFPTRYRSTGHGLSAACGKVGAIIAQVISLPLLYSSPTSSSSWRLDRLMQVFALFMLCGTLVSLLLPETRGITLEELAGEAPTQYNAGRNMSIAPSTTGRQPRHWWRGLNPFVGGQPAGFWYPRAGQRSWLGGQKPARVGIMSSPEQLARRGGSVGGYSERAGSSAGITGRKMSGLRGGGRRKDGSGGGDMDEFIFGVDEPRTADGSDMPVAPASVLPGWGAGWGRIDRGNLPQMEQIRLHDVGKLLK
jgi:PHS family inorganic phosphate transporter-like MFS transporter